MNIEIICGSLKIKLRITIKWVGYIIDCGGEKDEQKTTRLQ